jgi:hypothetical protein
MGLAVSNAILAKNAAPVPYLRVANVKHENFQSVASSDWLYQQADTAALPTMTVQMGCPVSGVLLVEAKNQLPSVRFLTDIGDVKYKLAEVLTVAIENADDQFVAVEPKNGWFGYGESEEKALRQFSCALVEQLEILRERQHELSDALHSELAQLQQLVIPAR